MADLKRLGRALRIQRIAAALGQKEAAALVGISSITLSRYENGRQRAPHDVIERLRAAYRERGSPDSDGSGDVDYNAERELFERGRAVEEKRSTFPQELKLAAHRFEGEAMELGADDNAIAFIHHALTSPEAMAMYHGGYQEPVSIEEMRQNQESLMRGLRLWLEEYLARQKEALRR